MEQRDTKNQHNSNNTDLDCDNEVLRSLMNTELMAADIANNDLANGSSASMNLINSEHNVDENTDSKTIQTTNQTIAQNNDQNNDQNTNQTSDQGSDQNTEQSICDQLNETKNLESNDTNKTAKNVLLTEKLLENLVDPLN